MFKKKKTTDRYTEGKEEREGKKGGEIVIHRDI